MNMSDLGPLVSVSVPPATMAWQAGEPEGSKGNGTPGRYKSVTGEVSHRLTPGRPGLYGLVTPTD